MTKIHLHRTRVKICGITRAEDGAEAARLGADAVGLVFYAASPRCVSVEQAQAIIAGLPPFVTTVGLFVNAPREDVDEILARVPLGLLQFHGDETPDYCAAFCRPYIKALRMRQGVDVHIAARRYADAAGLLLDSYQEGVPGGTGHRFDWGVIPNDLEKPIILAGGLDPGNVGVAVTEAQPFAVDVSSGVEANKGVKDFDKMAAFMRGVQIADAKR